MQGGGWRSSRPPRCVSIVDLDEKAPGGASMNEAQRKVLVRVSFTVSTLCLLLAGLAIACSAVGEE